MTPYLNLLGNVLHRGEESEDRTGTGTYSLFGPQMRFNLQSGFPILTTKRIWFRGVVEELLWFLRGSTNINDLPEDVQKLWRAWADEDGDVGPIYGEQFRNWKSYKETYSGIGPTGGTDEMTGCYTSQTQVQAFEEPVDQIAYIIRNIRDSPSSRRHVMTTWNPADIPDMGLPPCHGTAVQFYVRGGEYLDCKMYQRSADLFLGVPFNITSYSLLTTILAYLTGYKPGQFIHTFGDAHIYKNHLSQVKTQLEREPYAKPKLEFSPSFDSDVPVEQLHSHSIEHEEGRSIWQDLSFKDFELKGYQHHPHISAPISV